jgi:CubicO group peptidase (beta-lactamase class C family)
MDQTKMKELEQTISREYGNIVGIVVQQNGLTCFEQYFNGYTASDAFHVFSVTKSVFSALIGIAIGKGLIRSVDQKVLDFFPDYVVKAGETAIQNVTIKHLLTMTAPYKYESEPYQAFFASENWVNSALNVLGGDKPLGEFMYSPIVGTHILSGILEKAVGPSILAFATEHLFFPLGIQVPHNVVLRNEEEHHAVMNDKNTTGWVVDPQGINTASWGLFLTPGDMAKIGQLYADGGIWKGEQLVPAEWIEDSTREHSRWGELSYGYLWWIIDKNEPIYAALGDGGNVIYVNAKKKLVVSIASLFVPEVKDRIGFIMEFIEPVFGE